MENIQINGQKIWGPPKNWVGPPPPHGTEIYIKNLPDDVVELELFQIFSTVGKIYEVRLPVHWSGINRGYAFVRYTKTSEADIALKAFNMYEIRCGRTIRVERSVDNTRLFLSCVPNDKTSEEIKNDLQTIVENVEKVYVYPTLENPSVFRGYAFVEFKSHRDAAIAKRILTPDTCFNLFEKKCIAAWANPLPFLNEAVLKTINILFMRNVPKEVKSVTIKKVIENALDCSSLQKVKRLNDFAFLTFGSHESAKTALNFIKNHPNVLGDNAIQIEWAVPRDLIAGNGKNNDGWNRKRLSSVNFKKSNLLTACNFNEDCNNLYTNHENIKFNRSNLTDFQKRSSIGKESRITHILKNSSRNEFDLVEYTEHSSSYSNKAPNTWINKKKLWPVENKLSELYRPNSALQIAPSSNQMNTSLKATTELPGNTSSYLSYDDSTGMLSEPCSFLK